MKDQSMSKEQYESLEMEVITFDTEDVITTSGPGDDTEPVNPWD